jgi:hypothetical protein
MAILRKQKRYIYSAVFMVFVCAIAVSTLQYHPVFAAVPRLIFPVIGSSNYSNDFDAPRFNGKHQATDIIAKKRQKIVSASDGIIQYVEDWGTAGYSVRILDNDGYTYNYYHINNDNPGTDDGKGGYMNAFAPDVEPGNVVKRGQMIGYIGDSGNAENTVPHVHFEIYKGSRAINPYNHLNAAQKISKPLTYPALSNEILPFGRTAKVNVNVDRGNFTSANSKDILMGAGKGGGPHVKVFNSAGANIFNIFAYDKNARGGVDVAAGDVDGDGIDEIITGPGKGGGPHVRVFKPDGTRVASFFAYNTSNRDGINVSAGDVDGDGIDEIITGPQKGSGSHIKAFDVDGNVKSNFFAYDDTGFRDGVDVAVGDVNNDGMGDIITGPNAGGGPHIRVFKSNGDRINSFFGYDKDFRGGIRVSSGNVDNSRAGDEILVVAQTQGKSNVKMYSQNSLVRQKYFIEDWWVGSYDVAAGEGVSTASTGLNRRASVRPVF